MTFGKQIVSVLQRNIFSQRFASLEWRITKRSPLIARDTRFWWTVPVWCTWVWTWMYLLVWWSSFYIPKVTGHSLLIVFKPVPPFAWLTIGFWFKLIFVSLNGRIIFHIFYFSCGLLEWLSPKGEVSQRQGRESLDKETTLSWMYPTHWEDL